MKKRYTFMRFPGFKLRALTLSYDDGVIYDEKLIDIMSRYGLKGTFNLNVGYFSRGERYLSKDDAFKLYHDSGQEIAVHGYNHLRLAEVPKAVAVNDIISDRLALEEMFGTVITGMAYAYGSYNDEVVEVLKACGISYARTVTSTGAFDIPNDWFRLPATCHHDDARLMDLAKEFLAGEKRKVPNPELFYLWGHSYEFNDNNNWHIIEEFASYISGHEDVWYATNGEIYQYVKAFDSLIYSADGKKVYNPTVTTLYMKDGESTYIINPGETVKLA